ncbi:MAG: hypothetical protein ACR2OM_12465, partial [Aestuariivirgaceae bacterium]
YEPSKSHPLPSWVQETTPEPETSGNGWFYKGFAIAGCLVLASGIGLAVMTTEFNGSKTGVTATWDRSIGALLPSFGTQTKPLQKLPVAELPEIKLPEPPAGDLYTSIATKIGSVKLTVQDVQGAISKPIRLAVATDAGLSEPKIAVRLTGLPSDATLSAGRKQGDTGWVVTPEELTDLDMTLLSVPAAPIKVTVAAIETETGELAAPMQEMSIKIDQQSSVAVQPAALPLPVTSSKDNSSDAVASAPAPASEAAVAMRTRGDETLALGDVAGARGFYKKALQMGDVASAARIGRTYDPIVYQAVGVHGLKPDAQLAARWYELAITEGDASAQEDLNRLTQQNTQ